MKPAEEKAKQLKEPLPKVVQTKGAKQKQTANYNSDKVFNSKDVSESMKTLPSFTHMSGDLQKNIADRIWIKFNSYKGARHRVKHRHKKRFIVHFPNR